MTNETDRPLKQAGGKDLKPYTRPMLIKGPVLSNITADDAVSGNINDASDIRLKRDIYPIGRTESGLTLYRFRYLWSAVEMVGVMAQEVLEVAPEAVIQGADGFYRVDYGQLGLRCTTYADWLAERSLADAA